MSSHFLQNLTKISLRLNVSSVKESKKKNRTILFHVFLYKKNRTISDKIMQL